MRTFPILSGRMKRDPDGGLSVLCDDGGVRFVEAHASEPMPDYGPRHTAKKGLERHLSHAMPFWVVDRDTPLFTVKLTHMKGGGSILGLTMNHAVADGSSYMSFLESWVREHRGPQDTPSSATTAASSTHSAPRPRVTPVWAVPISRSSGGARSPPSSAAP
ncbi:hypothetical protein SANTM175S_10459 [Streptomyces antimycoticus]